MESEKVKEIKLALKKNIKLGLSYENDEKYCKVWLADILTLINELESENERLSKELDSEWKERRKADKDLHKAQWNYKIGLAQSQNRNKKLKDRIAELEKENAIKTDTIVDLLKKQEFYEKEKLTKFAERIKMEFYYQFDELIPSIMADKIDETLKECL